MADTKRFTVALKHEDQFDCLWTDEEVSNVSAEEIPAIVTRMLTHSTWNVYESYIKIEQDV